jgi:acetyltransferase
MAPATQAALDLVLPPTWSHANPIDIIGDANGARYEASLAALLVDEAVSAVLTLYCPTGVSSAPETAAGVIRAWAARPPGSAPAVLAAWLGGEAAGAARISLSQAGIPAFDTITAAVDGYTQLAEFSRNQRHLLRVPGHHAAGGDEPDRDTARAVFAAGRAAGWDWLEPLAVKSVLAAYGIPAVRSLVVASAEEAGAAAASIGGPVVLKIRSRAILHKSDIGGVMLNLTGAGSVRAAAEAMNARLAVARPDAPLEGFVVEEMIPGRMPLNSSPGSASIRPSVRSSCSARVGLGSRSSVIPPWPCPRWIWNWHGP